MFIEEHAAFAAILDAQQLPADLASLIGRVANCDLREKTVLDLCCGHGRVARAIASETAGVTAVDYSAPLLELAKAATPRFGNINWICLDAREAASFLTPHFDVIVRLYTSLGYFSFDDELKILKQCHALKANAATLIYDSFNGAWFRKNKEFSRKRNFGNIDLQETYSLKIVNNRETCDCVWESSKFKRPIVFELELYDENRVKELFQQSGWKIQSISGSLDNRVRLPEPWERLNIVATA